MTNVIAKRAHRKTALVTGASGVVGQALLTRLRDVDLVCLVHRTPVSAPNVHSVRGDITADRFGLPHDEYEALVSSVDIVLHCAAVTDFNRTDGTLEATNIGGTRNVIAFAEAAEAVLYHVSTAFVDIEADGERGRTAAGYAASKSAGEDLVRASRTPHVILRPSIVIGDSVTGEVAAFQGLHHVAAGIFGGIVPMIPFDARWPIDFVPSDVVADAIACVIAKGITSGEYWITAGEAALTLEAGVGICVELARELGVQIDEPRFVPPDLFDRLIGPVFLDALPDRVRLSITRILEFFTTYLRSGETKPSSLDELAALGMRPLPDQRDSLRASLAYWAERKGYADAEKAA